MPLDEESTILNSSKRHKLADEVEERYFADTGLPNCLFRRCVIYIDYPPSIEIINKLWALYEGCRDRFANFTLLFIIIKRFLYLYVFLFYHNRLKLIDLTLQYHDAQI